MRNFAIKMIELGDPSQLLARTWTARNAAIIACALATDRNESVTIFGPSIDRKGIRRHVMVPPRSGRQSKAGQVDEIQTRLIEMEIPAF